ncbi:hypothetical protein INS49_007774 [Diaporthe citri]|uniref:uncharacterized protein n=1 Tax=Diaporthe citri TaxID=83186 RepID=UPI001C7E92EC|nr:uncharacterized protein INS49_007774 [Diaporthe citri]KAG6362681.1 hypothetical protein INS49_007774 [Diaporthe citri]
METFDGFSILPTGPRDGGQGRRHVSPVWWSSDESSFAVSGLDERPADDFVSGDKTEDRTVLEQSVQAKAPNASTIHTTKAEPHTMSFANRLRRQPAAICLYERYLESGGCTIHESRESDAVGQQTICSTAATQDTTEGTNHHARRSCQLSAGMNQPELVKISSGPRRVSAQALAAMLEAGAWEDGGDSAGQQNAHKDNDRTSSDTEDTRTRSSIGSEEAAPTVRTGNITANIGQVQQFEAPNSSPQHAEFLNVHSSSVRHESLQLPARRNISTPHNHIEKQNNLDLLRSVMAKYDSKVKAHVKAKQRSRGHAVMRAETASRQAAKDHGARLARISNSRHWREPLGPKEVPRYANSMLLRGEDIPAYLHLRGRGNGGSRLYPQPPPFASSRTEAGQSRGNFELGQAQAIRFSKPGKASVVKIFPHKSRPFDFGSLGLVETNIMFSAGAVAKSARRTNMRAEGTRLRGERSADIDGRVKSESPVRDYQQSRIPRAVPGTGEHAAACPYKRPIGGSLTDRDRDVRFPQLVRRLKTNKVESNEDAGHAPVQDLSRLVPSAALTSEQRSTVHPPNNRWTTGGIQSSILKDKARHFSLDGNASQSRIANENDSPLTSPSKIQSKLNPPPGNSGCPSLISDDGQEPYDFPEVVGDQHARLPILQGPSGTSACEKEDTSTALNETSSDGSSTLVHISMNANELFSMSDTEAIHDENIRADEIHAGVGDSSYTERGWLFWANEAFTAPFSLYFDNGDSDIPAQRRGGRRVTGTRPDGPTLYSCCAILRWLISTTDAPGTPGMWHESSMGLELLTNAGEYQLRIDDDERAKMVRLLNCLYEGIELPPEPSDEVSEFIRSLNLQPVP